MKTEFADFEEFWEHYVKVHSNKTNRDLHFIGTSSALALAAAGILTGRKSLLIAAPVVGYAFAWAGHLLVEGNIPQTFGNPLWSLKGDFKMWAMTLRGEMDAEVERVARKAEAVAAEQEAPVSEVQATPADPTYN